ncbi:MAG TPA: hypothetical protein VFN25_04995 [Dokdonella sp.]|uniref:hypothetical protein n=1 Tax=Dokdonella sp. TaxID=2291710 RepID=UPI002D7E9450|nr:hypothetical protein [Dokdonella sp.]HET9032245.1 hypothetical protein [Dokdonella sp.]
MIKQMTRAFVLGVMFVALAAPSYAQTSSGNEDDDTVAKVETDGGVIMISDQGEFQTALPDQRVRSKAKLMVSNESSATVVYDNGCRQKYDDPGIYEISATCVLPYLASGSSSGVTKGWIVAGVLLGGAAVAAVIDHNGEGTSAPPPVSR